MARKIELDKIPDLDHWVDGTSKLARAALFAIDHGRCAACGTVPPHDAWEVHYLFPRKLGGRYARYRDLWTLCHACNGAFMCYARSKEPDTRRPYNHDWFQQFIGRDDDAVPEVVTVDAVFEV